MAHAHRTEPVVDETPGPEDDDATLGVGEPNDDDAVQNAPEAGLDWLFADPTIAPGLQTLIERRAAELAGTVPEAGNDSNALVKLLVAGIGEAIAASNAQLAGAINRSNEANAAQMPGFIKPIPVDELEARATAYTDARALLVDRIKRYRTLIDDGQDDEAQLLAPRYRLTEDAYEDASGEYQTAGTLIYWWRLPGTHMRPDNDIAKQLSGLMWRYIGGEKLSSADVLAETLASRRGQTNAPALPEIGLLSQRPQAELRMTRVTGSEYEDTGPTNVHGTVVTVTKGALGAAGTARYRVDSPSA